MRRSALAALLLPGLVLLASCSGRDTSQPVEPSFGKVESACLTDNQLSLYNLIKSGIDDLFLDRNARKAAHEHLDNIVSDLCPSPDYDAARQHLNSFVQQIAGQPEDQLEGEAPAWTDLVNWAIVLANDPKTFLDKLDPGVFDEAGGLGVLDPNLGDAFLPTRDGSARVTIFRDEEGVPVIVALSPHGGEVGTGGYQAFGPPYEIVSNYGFDKKAEVEVCWPMDLKLDEYGISDDAVFDRLVLLHDLGDGHTELLGHETSTFCDDYVGLMPAPTSGTNWLGRFARRAGNAVRTLLGPEPVRAMYFAGRGLAGLTGSFSPFVAVDPYTIEPIDGSDTITVGEGADMTVKVTWPSDAPDAPDPTVPGSPTMEWSSEPDGGVTFTGNGCELGTGELVCTVKVRGAVPGEATITATYPGLQVSKTVTVVRKLTVEVAVETPGILEISDNFGHAGELACSADDKWTAPTVCPWTYEGDVQGVTLTAVVHRKIEGSWEIWMEAADGTLLQTVRPGDQEEPYTFGPIDLDTYHKVIFTLKH